MRNRVVFVWVKSGMGTSIGIELVIEVREKDGLRIRRGWTVWRCRGRFEAKIFAMDLTKSAGQVTLAEHFFYYTAKSPSP